MNHTPLQVEAFGEWLRLTGYAKSSVYHLPKHVNEYLSWQEQNPNKRLHDYFVHLERRKHKTTRTGTLSIAYLYKHLQAIKRFSHYKTQLEQESIDTHIKLAKPKSQTKTILTKEEVQSLYEECTPTTLGVRDRAMLSVYYGCGLRRSEGAALDVTDFLPEQNLLYVRQGKNYKERYVPLTESVKVDLQHYIDYGRPQTKNLALFIGHKNTRIQGQSMALRLKQLQEKSGIKKEVSLHGLRHSIATHLLQSGMKLKHIAAFLGHQSLESTQIYAHL